MTPARWFRQGWLAVFLVLVSLRPVAAMADTGNSHSGGCFVQISDMHLGKPTSYETPEKMAAHLENANRIIDEVNTEIRPDFVLITGDTISVTDEASERLFAETIKRFTVPVYVVPGNHDDGSVKSGWFQKYVGPTRLVIEQGPWRVVAFDGRPLLRHENAPDLLSWLGTAMAERDAKDRTSHPALIVASHYPLHIPNRWENRRLPRRDFQFTGADALQFDSLLESHHVTAYLAGHTHQAYEMEDDLTGVPCLVTGAAQNGAYRICCWDTGIFSSAQSSVGSEPKAVITQPRARLEGGSDFISGIVPIRVRVFSREPIGSVTVSLKDGETRSLILGADGCWETAWDSIQVSDGRHDIVVHVVAGKRSVDTRISVAVSNKP